MDNIQTDSQNGVLHLILNRPEKKNALTSAMYTSLVEALKQADSDDSIRVIVLRGNGDSFTAGNDIEDFVQKPWKGQSVPPAEQFIRAVAFARKPVIAATHGLAVGIGTTILLHCDLVYAAEETRFMMPFINLAIIPEAGSTLLLPSMIGHQRAAELFLLAEPFSAQRAYELGIVNRVVPAGELLSVVDAAARTLAEKPAAAIRIAKQMMRQHLRADLDRVIREEVLAIAGQLESPETGEALSAFLQKRKPDFSRFR
ncbi:MAG: enoyl-CoA hydratase [Candidatus Korobacteraceae bacterium]